MEEMLQAKPPTTIELYTIKKHIAEIPHLQDKSVIKLSKKDFDSIEQTGWTNMVRG